MVTPTCTPVTTGSCTDWSVTGPDSQLPNTEPYNWICSSKAASLSLVKP